MAKPVDYFSDESLQQDLKGKTVRGGLFTAIGQAIQVGATLAVIPILGRLLTSEDFGLVAMVTALSAFAGVFVDVGLSMATVQRPKITHHQVSNLFWISFSLGAIITALLAVSSPAIAWFYIEPRLTAITLALCPSFLFAGLTIQPQALLRRAMRFRALAVIQVLSVISGYAVTIGIAWWYRSYWAMVAFPLVSVVVRMIATWSTCGWWPALPRRGTGVWSMLTFGGFLTGFNLTNYFGRNMDKVLIGWWWGATPLGFYERAYKLLMFPLQQINGPITGVAIPALSRVLDDPARYRRAYQTLLESLLLVTTPLMAFVFVTRDLCVEVLLGPQWTEVVPIFAWLGIGAMVQPFTFTLGWLLISQGRTREMFQWSIFASIVSVTSYAVGLRWGPVTVAAAYVITNITLHMPTLVYVATRSGSVRAQDLLPAVKMPCGLAVIAFVGTLLFRRMFSTGNSFFDLAIYLVATVAVCMATMLITSAGRRRLTYYSSSLLQGKLPQKDDSRATDDLSTVE